MCSVLVVDDESAAGRLLSRVLGKAHTVRALTSAREALAQIEQGDRFDVILCDVNMPEMNGTAFHAEVSRLSREQARRIVFLTGGQAPALPNRSLAKPFQLAELLELVGEVVPIRSAQDAWVEPESSREGAADGVRRSVDGAGQPGPCVR